MSKEAVGQNGAVLGSPDYWDRLNRPAYIGAVMERASETEYFEAVKQIGQRAASAIDSIYADLQKSKKAIHNISFSDRNALSRQVQALGDVCSLSTRSYRPKSTSLLQKEFIFAKMYDIRGKTFIFFV